MSDIAKRPHVVSVYGYDYTAEVPAALADLVALVGEDAVYKNALDNLIYRGIGPDVAAKVLENLRKLPGVKFHLDENGKPLDKLPKGQTQMQHIKAEYDKSQGDIESVITRTVIQTAGEFDYIKGIREAATGGRASGNIGQEWLTAATQLIEAVRDKYNGTPEFDRWLAAQRQWVPGAALDDPNGDGWPSVECVALICRNVHRAKTKQSVLSDL